MILNSSLSLSKGTYYSTTYILLILNFFILSPKVYVLCSMFYVLISPIAYPLNNGITTACNSAG